MPLEQEPRGLAEVLAEFAQILTGEHQLRDVLVRLGDYCTELLPVDAIGVLIASDGAEELEVATANSSTGDAVEHLEVELHEGPCTDSVRREEQVFAPDLEAFADRYPRFVPRALELGVRSVHALPMASRGAVVATLDIMAWEPVHLSQHQVDTAQLLADVALALVLNTHRHDEASRLASQLQSALESRVLIEQAKGRLAERHGEPMSAAFDRLRRHARQNGERLRHVAEAVVHGELRV